ncbi:MAG: hypothetical protein F6J94_06470 [Moorea sp. SIO1F2]|nr:MULTISPECIES: hypothetical protein [unclassified Moorena]NEP20737.1 hypothetical protein [Moorena sp. SIO3I6]NET81611.1 hypothetical protein [Moorena sp. SIO1F2]
MSAKLIVLVLPLPDGICRLGRGFLNHRQEKTPGTVKDFHRDAQVTYD